MRAPLKKKYRISVLAMCLLTINSVRAQQQADAGVTVTLTAFDYQKPTFKLEDEQQENTNRWLRYSLLSGYREGVAPIKGMANFKSFDDSIQRTSRIGMYNLSLQDMLTHGFFTSSRVILEVKDPSQYRYEAKYGDKLDWMRRNARCFELLLPSGAFGGSANLEKELAHVLGVTISIQNLLVDALVLVRTSNHDKVKSSGAKSLNDGKGKLINLPLDQLVRLIEQAVILPVVDETGYTNEVDLDLGIKSWTDIVAVRKALSRYDLDLQPVKRNLRMFVIADNQSQINNQR